MLDNKRRKNEIARIAEVHLKLGSTHLPVQGDLTRACVNNGTHYFCGSSDLFTYRQVTSPDHDPIGRIFVVRQALTAEVNDPGRTKSDEEVEDYIALDYYTQKATAKHKVYKDSHLPDERDLVEHAHQLFPSSKRARIEFDRSRKAEPLQVGELLTLQNTNVHSDDIQSVKLFQGVIIEHSPYIMKKTLGYMMTCVRSESFGTVILRVDQARYALLRPIRLKPLKTKKPERRMIQA